MKRLFDLAVSVIGIVLLVPVFAAIAILVKCDSPGPVFFRHLRVGMSGKPFHMVKFRTMHDALSSPRLQMAIGTDKRVTRAGNFLRRYKLDELPQLFNVLAGQMSLVGPRPEIPLYVAQYSPRDRDIVLSVRPGITDLASIRFRNESEYLARQRDPERVYIEDILPRKLRLNRFYVRHQSMRFDLMLILMTVYAVLGGRVVESAFRPISATGRNSE